MSSSAGLPLGVLAPVVMGALGSCLAVGAVLGLGVGGVLALTRVQRLQQTVVSTKRTLPPHVAATPELSEPLLTLVRGAPKPNRAAFAHLTAKINTMVQVAMDLAAADPTSVEESMVSVGTHMFDSICNRLQVFYAESGVTTVRTRFETLGLPPLPDSFQEEHPRGRDTSSMTSAVRAASAKRVSMDGMVGSGTLEPLQRDMRAAHQALMDILSELAAVMAETARDKFLAAVVKKYA
jgi:hypothetical protein